MAETKLGKLITDPKEMVRDADHVAHMPAIASEDLEPGTHVAVQKHGDDYQARYAPNGANAVGIVDPFLLTKVKKGQRFRLCLYPGTITGLSHHWTHPAIDRTDAEAAKKASTLWLIDFADKSDCPDFNTLLAAAVGEHEKNKGEDDEYTFSSNDGEYLHFGGRDAHGDIPPEFWDHVEIATGKKIPQNMRAKAFSCSC